MVVSYSVNLKEYLLINWIEIAWSDWADILLIKLIACDIIKRSDYYMIVNITEM